MQILQPVLKKMNKRRMFWMKSRHSLFGTKAKQSLMKRIFPSLLVVVAIILLMSLSVFADSSDADGDGLTYDEEMFYGTDPLDADTDDDGLWDGYEIFTVETNPKDPDTDNDQLTDFEEWNWYHTDPNDYDTDNDTLPDGPEVTIYGTDPLLRDTDFDGLYDGEELYEYYTDPLDSDTDNDGLKDGTEVYYYETDPNDDDTDHDNLDDGDELTYGTNPKNPDSDFDSLPDGYEVHISGTDPTDDDTDHDGLDDGDEIYIFFTDPFDRDSDDDLIEDGDEVYVYGTNPAEKDTDSDGLNDGVELLFGTNPLVADTDEDGLPDGHEAHNTMTDPTDPDTDDDGINDGNEIYITFTDPLDDDSDDDGFDDGEEFYEGTDPNDPTDFPNVAPVADADSYSVNEDELLSVVAPGVLNGDTDANGDVLLVNRLTDAPDHGVLHLYNDGHFTYMPDANFHGTDSFKYRAIDAELESNEATVTIEVISVNDVPVITPVDDITVEWGKTIIIDIDASDIDLTDGDPTDESLTFSYAPDLPAGILGPIFNSITGVLVWRPGADDIGNHTITLIVTDAAGATDSDTVKITVEKRTPTLTIDAPASRQYSDQVKAKATLLGYLDAPIADELLNLVIGTQNAADYTNASGIALIYLTLNQPASTPGLTVQFAGNDWYKPASLSKSFEITRENACGDLQSEVAHKTPPGSAYTDPLVLTVWVREAYDPVAGEPIGEPLAEPGDIGLAQVSTAKLVPIVGGSISGTAVAGSKVGTGYGATIPITITFTADVPVNTYTLSLNIEGAYYIGTYESVIVVYDPTLGFTSGGGWFIMPGTAHEGYAGDKVSFGFTMKYNKKGQSIQGNLILIQHLPDGMTQYKIKSNALYGLALSPADAPIGTASFSGKCTYVGPETWPAVVGGKEFIVYVEDIAEPGAHNDRIWFSVLGQALTLDANHDKKVTGECVVLEGGNITVPHKPAK